LPPLKCWPIRRWTSISLWLTGSVTRADGTIFHE